MNKTLRKCLFLCIVTGGGISIVKSQVNSLLKEVA